MAGSGEYINEPFNPAFKNWGVEHLPQLPDITLENIQDLSNEYNIRLFKTLEFQLSEDDNIKLLNLCTTNIFLYRKYYVDHYASRWMSYNFFVKTNRQRYVGHHIKDDKEFFTIERDPIDINYMKQLYQELLEKINLYKSQVSFDAFVDYETLFPETLKERQFQIAKLCKQIGFELETDTHTGPILINNKHNSVENYKKLIPNWDDILALRDELILEVRS
jgi:hypothetical protein